MSDPMTIDDLCSGMEQRMLAELANHQPGEDSLDCACGFSPWTLEHVVVACLYSDAMRVVTRALDAANERGFVRGRAFRG